MKICIFGAGAIGGLIAARLSQVACEVSIVARGPHLDAVRGRGLTLRSGGTELTCRIPASADGSDLEVQDYVFLTVKTSGLTQALSAIAPLIDPHTTVVPAMNGVPWWFFSGFGGALEGARLDGVDPGGLIASAIPVKQVLGCVVYPTAFVAQPGVVQHTGRWDLYLGELGGQASVRSQALCDLLNAAGFTCRLTSDIRREIWTKLVGNASLNPVCALSLATLDRMLADPHLYRLLAALMTEVIAVGRALGLQIEETPEARLERGRPLGPVKLSMLQDLEHNRPIEHESLTGAVVEIGERLGMDVPMLQAIHGLIRQRALSMGR